MTTRDDALLDRLSRSLTPVRPRHALREATLFAAICLAELALVLIIGLARPDMAMAMRQPSFWWKLASLGLIGLGGAGVSIASLDPTASPQRGLRWLGVLVVCCLAAGLLVDGLDRSWRAGVPDGELMARLAWRSGLRCVAKMMLLSLPPLLGLGFLMRRGAASHPRTTALCAGLSAGAWGAFVFVFACPSDDPLYVAVWYLAGCGLVTGLGRVLLRPLTRW